MLGYWLEGSKLLRAEMALARRFDYCTCTTRAEFETLLGYGVDTPSGWFPNGVDLDYFMPSSEPYDPDALVFIGRMEFFPIQDAMLAFCANVLPALRAERPNTTLTIVGAEPTKAIRFLGEVSGVHVTGTVSDVRPYVHRAPAVSVAPLNIARGTQNKILESMAMGVPVVASEVAAHGVDAAPGEHYLATSKLQEYVDSLLRLLNDASERARFAAAGRARAETNHSWPESMAKLDCIIEDCLARWHAVHTNGSADHASADWASRRFA